MALPDTFDKLKELLAQDQFEVLLDEENKDCLLYTSDAADE